jgi:hypothetical protein
MKHLVFLAAAVGVVLMTAPAHADFAAISHNLLNGQADTSYNAGTGEFRVYSTVNNSLSLYDPGPATLPGAITNAVIDLSTFFDSVLLNPSRAKFLGGTLSLTFDYDADGAGPGLATSHELSGTIDHIDFTISPAGPLWKMDGAGLWNALVKNLPGSGLWPTTLSSIDSLTIVFNQNLSNWDWENDSLTGRAETQYSLLPTPEPTTVLVLVLGGFCLGKRRSA